MNKKYSPLNDNVKNNANRQGIDYSLSRDKQEQTKYPCVDKLQNATINDDHIYLSTFGEQHDAIANGQPLEGHCSLTGYFTSENTASKYVNPENSTFDSYGFHRATCVTPYSFDGTLKNLSDKGHLDCFQIDRDRMEDIYGTRDFNAAIGKCDANNQYGPDGGDQGYNANLNELYNNGCLKYAGTYDAEPGSTTKCQDQYEKMTGYTEGKNKAILAGQEPEDVQKIGYPLDESCHQKTGFNAQMHPNLEKDYAGHEPKYNSELANSTQNGDRKAENEHKITPAQKNEENNNVTMAGLFDNSEDTGTGQKNNTVTKQNDNDIDKNKGNTHNPKVQEQPNGTTMDDTANDHENDKTDTGKGREKPKGEEMSEIAPDKKSGPKQEDTAKKDNTQDNDNTIKP